MFWWLLGRRGWLAVSQPWPPGAYAIAIWAMTHALIGLVTALRETSILFAVLIGWIFFAERMALGKSVAAVLIVAGVILTRL